MSSQPGPAAPSSSGRTADFGSVSRGSNPRGAANLTPAAQVSRIPGDVAKWPNAGVCKTSIRRFDSGRRLHILTLNGPPGPAPGGLFVFCEGFDVARGATKRPDGGRRAGRSPRNRVSWSGAPRATAHQPAEARRQHGTPLGTGTMPGSDDGRRRGGGTGRRGGLKHRWERSRASSNLALGTRLAAIGRTVPYASVDPDPLEGPGSLAPARSTSSTGCPRTTRPTGLRRPGTTSTGS